MNNIKWKSFFIPTTRFFTVNPHWTLLDTGDSDAARPQPLIQKGNSHSPASQIQQKLTPDWEQQRITIPAGQVPNQRTD